MPLVGLRCPQGHEYTTLLGPTIAEQDDACPVCGAAGDEGQKLVGAGLPRKGGKRYFTDLSPEERARFDVTLAQESLAEYDDMADDLLSGELELDESRTFEEFRPQVPESKRKRYY